MLINPTPGALEYLFRHKGAGAPVDKIWPKQVYRASKRVSKIAEIVQQYSPKSMLDIGCGLATITTMIVKRFGIERVHLVDGDGNSPIQHDYQEDMKAWNDVHVAVELVQANVLPHVQVIGHLANAKLEIEPVDMICSFKSWGVHYPLNTYMNVACRCLKPGGLLLIDIIEERGPGNKNDLIASQGFRLIRMLDLRLRAFERI